jgi:hypothetical protein
VIRWLLIVVTALLLWPRGVLAEVERYAIVIGNDVGDASDAPLGYAESDAAKIHGVLRELGAFQPANTVLLQGQDERTVRSTIIAFNDRVRSSEESGRESILFVFYSGHADADALHLGKSRLSIQELAQLVRGSAATFRLLVLDACRSGALTRVKGGRSVPAFDVPLRSRLTGKGLAFLTASSASEDAQESEELRGSFFTTALVSGLMGAADRNQDGLVSLEEAYRYAYDVTVRATSRTVHGVQHPTFHYDLRGQDGLVLTELRSASRERAALSLPAGLGFLVMRGHRDGPVIAEVPAYATARKLSLPPGPYFLRGRGPEFLLEGEVALRASEVRVIDARSLERVQYARYVRKGQADATRSHAAELGPTVHSPLPGSDGPCLGAVAGYALDLPHLHLSARTGMCRGQLSTRRVRGTSSEYDLSLAAAYPWDLGNLTLAVGMGAGVLVNHQSFETRGRAPSRTSTEPFALLVAHLTYELTGPWFMRLEGRGSFHFVRLVDAATSDPMFDVAVAARGTLLVGAYLGASGRR